MSCTTRKQSKPWKRGWHMSTHVCSWVVIVATDADNDDIATRKAMKLAARHRIFTVTFLKRSAHGLQGCSFQGYPSLIIPSAVHGR